MRIIKDSIGQKLESGPHNDMGNPVRWFKSDKPLPLLTGIRRFSDITGSNIKMGTNQGQRSSLRGVSLDE